MSELKSCPFCGGKAEFSDEMAYKCKVFCSKCGVETNNYISDTEATASYYAKTEWEEAIEKIQDNILK